MSPDFVTHSLLSQNTTQGLTAPLLEQVIERALVRYVLPVIICVGIIGNTLSFAVLSRSRMRRTSVYFYLTVLSCADTAVLFMSGFKTWIRLVTGFEFLHLSDAACRGTMFLLVFFLHFSAWLLVLVTGDRFIAVWFPFKAAVVCSARRARLAVLILALVITMYNFHLFWTVNLKYISPDEQFQTSSNHSSPEDLTISNSISQVTTIDYGYEKITNATQASQSRISPAIYTIPKCAGRSDLLFMKQPFEYLKLATYSVLPFMIILVTNILIAAKLRWSAPIRQNLIAGPKSRNRADSNVMRELSSTNSGYDRITVGSVASKRTLTSSADQSTLGRQSRVTYMLLTVSVAYLLLSGPFTLNLILSNQSSDDLIRARIQLLRAVCFFLMYCNHAINFFLYCLTGRKFRQELWEMFAVLGRPCGARRHRPLPQSTRVITCRSERNKVSHVGR